MKTKNINKYVNGLDLEKVGLIFNFDNKFIWKSSEIESIEELFQGKNYFAFILLNDHLNVGHWVVLRKDHDNSYTYFDCLAKELPENLKILFNIDKNKNGPLNIYVLNKALMAPDGIICGKYCISFVMAGSITLEAYSNTLTSAKTKSIDEIIDSLYQIDYTENKIVFE